MRRKYPKATSFSIFKYGCKQNNAFTFPAYEGEVLWSARCEINFCIIKGPGTFWPRTVDTRTYKIPRRLSPYVHMNNSFFTIR